MPHSPTTRIPNRKYVQAARHLVAAVDAGASWSGRERNRFFLNLGETRFATVSACSGLDFIDDGRCVGVVDWDHDGDLDLWLANRTGPRLRLMRNDTPSRNHFIAVKLVGTRCNRDAIGARVELRFTDSARPRVKTVRAGQGFLAQSSKVIHFGLGSRAEIERLVIHWPDGTSRNFDDPQVDTRYKIVQGSGVMEALSGNRNLDLSPSELHDRGASDEARVVLPNRRNMGWLAYLTPEGQQAQVDHHLAGPVLINLWATSCQPCLEELREFSERAAEIRSAGVNILALDVTHAVEPTVALSEADRLLSRLDYPFEQGSISKSALRKVGKQLKQVLASHARFIAPTSLLLDADYRLVAVYRGPIPVDTLLADVELTRLSDDQLADRAVPFSGRWFASPLEK